jgi:hypothetical protein
VNFLVKTLVRVLVLSAIDVLALVLIYLSNTTDPLGPGLLLFLVFVLVALVWGVLDGRGAARQAILVWVLVSALVGVELAVSTAVVDDASGLTGSDIGSTVLFAMALLLPPALVGIGIGALLGRNKS